MTKIPTRDVQIGEIVDDAIARILALTGEHAENVPDHDPNHEREEVVGSRDVPNNRQSIAPEQTRSVPAPPSAPATVEVRYDAFMSVLASLVAATDLLKRGGKRAAPSNKMFDQMIRDYEAAITLGRNALTAPASAASFMDGVEAIEAARDRYVAAVDPDPSARTAWQSGAIEDGFRLSLAAVRALTPPAASQDSGVFTGLPRYGDFADFALSPERGDNAIAAANLLRTPDIAATGGPSGDEIAEWRRLADAATAGPWQAGDGAFSRNCVLAQGCTDTYAGSVWSTIFRADLVYAQDDDGRAWYTSGSVEANTAFIAAARTAVPKLIDAVTRLTADLAARTGERDKARSRYDEIVKADTKEWFRQRDRADALQQRVGALEEALKPFATAASRINEWEDLDNQFADTDEIPEIGVTCGHVRDAANALSQTPTPNAKTEGE